MKSHAFFSLALLGIAATGSTQKLPDLGPNTVVFSPSMPAAEMQAKIDAAYAVEQHNEFGDQRYAFLFLPGDYKLNVPVGFYTEVAGLGAAPKDVRITGDVHSDAQSARHNATTTFWRAVEGLDIMPRGGELGDGTMRWAVSQATSLRRTHIEGALVLHHDHGWASGGWLADSVVDGNIDSGTQQQWMTRNSDFKSWTGANWNIVFVGDPEAPANAWPTPGYTTVAAAPITREKPFLYVDGKGAWQVRVPALRRESAGVAWRGGETPGTSIPLAKFYIAQAGRDTAATINAHLAKGMHLLLTPGIYELNEPLRVERKGTVVLGLGYATLHPTAGNAVLTTADADGIVIAGLLVRAGEQESPVLVQVGPKGSHTAHAADPISLHDIFFDAGGAVPGRVGINLEVNSANTIIDHTWIWRADHGHAVGWDRNVSRNGLVVNGNDVIAYGLFVEHHNEFQVVWNGDRGRMYMYQSEIPYDPPTQSAYIGPHGEHGWASYKVGDGVTSHEAWGLGVYSVFKQPDVSLDHAIETPVKPGVQFHDIITVCLLTHEGIDHMVNETGPAATCKPHNWPRMTLFP